MNNKVIGFGISFDEILLKKLVDLISRKEYMNRSEVLRDHICDILVSEVI